MCEKKKSGSLKKKKKKVNESEILLFHVLWKASLQSLAINVFFFSLRRHGTLEKFGTYNYKTKRVLLLQVSTQERKLMLKVFE